MGEGQGKQKYNKSLVKEGRKHRVGQGKQSRAGGADT